MPGLYTTADDEDVKDAEDRVVDELQSRAINQISGINSPNDMHIRDILPDADLESGADNGWSGSTR